MEKIIVYIRNKRKAAFTKELLSSFDFLEIEEIKVETPPEKKLSKNRQRELINAFKEVKDSLEGKKRIKIL